MQKVIPYALLYGSIGYLALLYYSDYVLTKKQNKPAAKITIHMPNCSQLKSQSEEQRVDQYIRLCQQTLDTLHHDYYTINQKKIKNHKESGKSSIISFTNWKKQTKYNSPVEIQVHSRYVEYGNILGIRAKQIEKHEILKKHSGIDVWQEYLGFIQRPKNLDFSPQCWKITQNEQLLCRCLNHCDALTTQLRQSLV